MKELSLVYYIDGEAAAMCYEGQEHLVIERISRLTERNAEMTPQEELFAKFFNHKVELVKDMDVLQLRAHLEEMSMTVFKAKAEYQAVDKVKKEKEKTTRGQGFQTSLHIDDASSDAINKITERQKKLTKMEKVMQGLIEMGVKPEDAQSMTSNSAIEDLRRKKEGVNAEHQFNSNVDKIVNEATKPAQPSKPLVNPFAKKIEE